MKKKRYQCRQGKNQCAQDREEGEGLLGTILPLKKKSEEGKGHQGAHPPLLLLETMSNHEFLKREDSH